MMKRGVALFMPLFVVVTIVALALLAYVMAKNNAERETGDLVGQQAVSLLKVYDEGQRATLFLEQALPYAVQDARKVLGEQGGYAAQNACQRMVSDASFVVLNACEAFNPEKHFLTQLQRSLEEVTQFYESPYRQYRFSEGLQQSLFEAFGLLDDPVQTNLVHAYTESVRKATVAKMLQQGEATLFEFTPLVYVIEFVPSGSLYTLTPRVKLERQDFTVYQDAFAVASACLGKPAQACQEKFQKAFSTAQVSVDGGIVKVVIPTAREVVKFAVDLTKPLPFQEADTSIS